MNVGPRSVCHATVSFRATSYGSLTGHGPIIRVQRDNQTNVIRKIQRQCQTAVHATRLREVRFNEVIFPSKKSRHIGANRAIGIIKDTKQQAQTALNVISLSQKILFLLEFLGNTWKLTMFEDDRYHRSRFFCRKKTSSSLAQSLNRSFSI